MVNADFQIGNVILKAEADQLVSDVAKAPNDRSGQAESVR